VVVGPNAIVERNPELFHKSADILHGSRDISCGS
jgi:hypothetical protein